MAAVAGAVALAVGNDRLFGRLCEAIGVPELARDPRFLTNADRVEHVDELGVALEAVFGTRPAAEWIETLRAAAVPAGPINDVSEAWALAERLGLSPVDAATGVPNPPLRLSGSRPEVRLPPPALDAHGEEIRRWLKG